jgi:hypothetical protein
MRTPVSVLWLAAALLALMGGFAMAVEEAAYKVIETDGPFEIRRYEPCVVAETVVESDLEDAGNIAFRRLFGYISGKNRRQEKIAMTAPVSQEPGLKIAMTAPVSQEPAGRGWAVSFMMPASFTLETLPEPADSNVRLRPIPARFMAAVRYSGRWTEASYQEQKKGLLAWAGKRGLVTTGAPVWARYNPPFTPSFFRRNEVLQPVADPGPASP